MKKAMPNIQGTVFCEKTIIFANHSILDVWQVSEYDSVLHTWRGMETPLLILFLSSVWNPTYEQ